MPQPQNLNTICSAVVTAVARNRIKLRNALIP